MLIKFENDRGRWTIKFSDIDHFVIHAEPWSLTIFTGVSEPELKIVPPEIFATIVMTTMRAGGPHTPDGYGCHYIHSMDEAQWVQSQLDRFVGKKGE